MLQRKNKWCGSVTGASKRAITFLPPLTLWRSMSLTALAFALRTDENSNCDRFEMARAQFNQGATTQRQPFLQSSHRIRCYDIWKHNTNHNHWVCSSAVITTIFTSKDSIKTRRRIKENKAAFCRLLSNRLYNEWLNAVHSLFLIFCCAVERESFCMRGVVYLSSCTFSTPPIM